eukprot:Tbor_TRINITY_DN2679_c0_g1::TRINITY_DN2679_c0_g1_i1::g.17895::m.17895
MNRRSASVKGRELSPATEYRRKRNMILGLKEGSISSTLAQQSNTSVCQVNESDQRKHRMVTDNRGGSRTSPASTTRVSNPNHYNGLSKKQPGMSAGRICPYAGCTSSSPAHVDALSSYLEGADCSKENIHMAGSSDKDRNISNTRGSSIEVSRLSKPSHSPRRSSPKQFMTPLGVKEILDENDKLKLVEREFWAILKEKEDIQDEVVALKRQLVEVTNRNQLTDPPMHYQKNSIISSTGNRTLEDIINDTDRRAKGKVSIRNGGTCSDYNNQNDVIIHRLKQNVDTLKTALHDCMDLLIQSDMKGKDLPNGMGNIQRDGPVAVFLRWLNTTHNRQRALDGIHEVMIEEGGNSAAWHQSPSISLVRNVSMSPVRADVGITEQHRQTLDQLRRVQEELDRTDLSRQQALEDADKIRRQMELLAANLTAIKNDFRQYKSNVDANSKVISEREATQAQHQKSRLAQKDAEIHELKARIVHLERTLGNGTIELAKDADRISRDLQARRSQSSHRAYSNERPLSTSIYITKNVINQEAFDDL